MPPTAPTTRFALRGRVVTMNATREVVNNGVIYIADGTIVQVAAAGSPPPADAPAAHKPTTQA